MQRLPLIGGSYSARSVIANAQRCINLYPEENRHDAPVPVTHYQRPGLTPLATPSANNGRAIYRASNGDGYMIVGGTVYFIAPDWTLTSIGAVSDNADTPCTMIDNGIQCLIAVEAIGAGNAAGSISFAVNPTAGDTITLNGVVWTFIAGASSGTNVQIGGTLGFTIFGNLLSAVQASTNPAMLEATYSGATVGANAELRITYREPGAQGNTYTLAASAATPSGSILSLLTVYPGQGWYFSLNNPFAGITQITDVSWSGATRADYLDTYLLWNAPGTNEFWCSDSNTLVPIDPLYYATKTSYPDQIQSLIVSRNEVVILGTLKSEVWYLTGDAQFPFARAQGTNIEHGTCAKYSPAAADLSVFWLSQDLAGQGIVYRRRGNEIARISNFALEFALQQMARAGTISDAVGYCYQRDGHWFYKLTFPDGNQTWVWDESVGDPMLGWHQEAWVGTNGSFNRSRGWLGAFLHGKNVEIDWENGTLYEMDTEAYTDTVSGVEYPITYIRTFPHLMTGTSPVDGSPILANGKIIQHNALMLDVTVGTSEVLPGGKEPMFMLRYSDDRGVTWNTAPPQTAGALGKYTTRPTWMNLGMAMDRVYEVSWSFPGPVALNGAWVEGKVLNQ